MKEPADGRETSRKWLLTVGGMALYTAVHLLNAGAVLVALHNKWLAEAGAVSLWTHSLTTWSAGVLAFAAIYKTANVIQKWSPDTTERE